MKLNKIYYILLGILLIIIISMTSILIYRNYEQKKEDKEAKIKEEIKQELKEEEQKNKEEQAKKEEQTNNVTASNNNYDYSADYPNEVQNEADKKMINYFSSAKAELQSLNNSSSVDKVKSKGKEYFITMADFLFYGKDINGVHLTDISDKTKSVLWKIFGEIDGQVIKVYPNYKDDLGDAYSTIKDVSSTTYTKAKEKIKETIGEDNYNKVGDTKNNVKAKAKETYNSAKEKVSNWYQKFKEGN